MSADTEEFARFGPWIDQVRHDSDLPRLFRGAGLDIEAARSVWKIPRNIARRDAHAGMNLYEHIVAVYPDGVEVFTRNPSNPQGESPGSDTVRRHFIHGSDLVGTTNMVDLLAGELTIYSRTDAPLRITYNGSSGDSVTRMCDQMSKILSSSESEIHLPSSPPSLPLREQLRAGGLDLAAEYAAAAKLDPTLRVLFAQERVRLQRLPKMGGRAVARIADGINPVVAYEFVAAESAHTFVMFTRRRPTGRAASPIHSVTRAVFGRTQLDHVSLTPHPAFQGLSAVRLGAGKGSWAIDVPTETPAHKFFIQAATRV